MNEREMLEFAAKAAGIDLGKAQDGKFFYCEHGQRGCGMYLVDGNYLQFWNPRTDDGDALRLAVKLGEKYLCCVVGIVNRAAFPHASASVAHRDGSGTYIEQDVEGDIAAATRRAIVRAAAEIGKAMP